MNVTTPESILITTCFFLMLAAFMSLFRSERSIMTLNEQEYAKLRAIIRAEIAQYDHEAQQRMTAAFLDKLEENDPPKPSARTCHVRSVA